MEPSVSLTNLQQARLDRFSCDCSVDVHSHILPEIDDGPESMEQSIALARGLVRDGITHVIATPHQMGRWEGRNHAAAIRAKMLQTQQAFDALKLPLKIAAGAEVRVDPAIPKLFEQDIILSLADSKKHLLLELPTQVAMGADTLTRHLAGTGLKIVLAHAERYEMHRSDPASAQAWVDAGAILQVNAGSITGANGEKLQNMSFDWISKGWISLIASDAHSTGTRRPRMTEAINVLIEQFGDAVARLICLENPSRVLKGEDLQTPGPAQRKTP
jgi:protein-tyrosine phosphatase